MHKQIIIARKDLNMSPGKLAAQVAHGSIAFLIRQIQESSHLVEENKYRIGPYMRGELWNWSKEAEARGEDHFFAGPVNPSDPYGALELQSRRAHIESTLAFSEELYSEWINEAQTKVILEAKGKKDIYKAINLASENGLIAGKDYFLIFDACRTELEPEGENGTLTVIGFRPLEVELADKIGKKFQLWKN